MLAQLPSNMLITRVRPAIYLPVCALLWSGVSAATAAVTSAGQLFAVQFVLGIIEAPLFPGVSFSPINPNDDLQSVGCASEEAQRVFCGFFSTLKEPFILRGVQLFITRHRLTP